MTSCYLAGLPRNLICPNVPVTLFSLLTCWVTSAEEFEGKPTVAFMGGVHYAGLPSVGLKVELVPATQSQTERN